MSSFDKLPSFERRMTQLKEMHRCIIENTKRDAYKYGIAREIICRMDPDLKCVHSDATCYNAYFNVDNCEQALRMLSRVDDNGLTVHLDEVYMDNAEMRACVRYGDVKSVTVYTDRDKGETEEFDLPCEVFHVTFWFNGNNGCRVEYYEVMEKVTKSRVICK